MENSTIQALLENNREWVKGKLEIDSDYFKKLAEQQTPEFLWIGCADSRVPANEITGTAPGEVFVHRNIANLVVHTDVNMLSVVQYAVQVLKVKHIIVCGHYGCGGVIAALTNNNYGLVNKWLTNIKEVYVKYNDELERLRSDKEKADRLVELNVIEQVKNVSEISFVQEAWTTRELKVHGWVYGLDNGIIKDLGCGISGIEGVDPIFRYL